jgi:hypothetical protein
LALTERCCSHLTDADSIHSADILEHLPFDYLRFTLRRKEDAFEFCLQLPAITKTT